MFQCLESEQDKKAFFFEKKKQKTLDTGGFGLNKRDLTTLAFLVVFFKRTKLLHEVFECHDFFRTDSYMRAGWRTALTLKGIVC